MAFPVGARTTGELITASIWNADLKDNLNTLRAGGVAIASQAALDFVYGSSATQLARLAKGTALQVPRMNAADDGWEFALVSSPRVVQGRLTLESGVPVSSTDQSAKTTLYFTPYNGDQFMFYDGTLVTFAELSLSLAAYTASKPYDIFGYNNGGVLALESLVWTSATARATGVTRQTNGVWTKTGDTTRMLLGTIYINSSGGQTDDTYAKRNVWNVYNRVTRPMRVLEANTTWTYATAAWQQANGSALNQLEITVGLAEVGLTAHVLVTAVSSTAQSRWATGIGFDSTSAIATGSQTQANSTTGTDTTFIKCTAASYKTQPAVGRHTVVWLEQAVDAVTITFLGTSVWNSGIDGTIEG